MPGRTNDARTRNNVPSPMAGLIVVPVEILEFIRSGAPVIVGVVGPDGPAKAGRAHATRVAEGGALRWMYPTDGNMAISAVVRSGGLLAGTFGALLSHRTIQLKAASSREEQLEPQDRISVECQMDAFAAVLRGFGFPPCFLRAFCDNRSTHIIGLSFVPQAAYEQTPGPGAGRER